MQYYCGIDLHSKDSWVCVIDEKDRIQLRKKVPNHLPTILHELDNFSSKPSAVVESTMNWYWLVDGLQDAGVEVKLAHIFGLHMITGAKVKTDRRDAFSLARLLRLDAVPEAYIYPKQRRPVRDLLRRRNRLVSVRAGAYRSMKQVLSQQGKQGYSLTDLKRFDEAMILRLFDHPALQASMQMELDRIRLYSLQINTLERIIQKSVANEPLFELLQTIPGVAKILGLTIFYEVGDIERFRGPKPFCSYARVVPGVAQSSSVTRRGRGSKQGNPYLKWAFMQAAGISVRYDPDVRKFRQTHMARRRSKARRLISLSIVAHKLAIGAYFVLKDRVPFRMELMFAK
jgi:transposase